MDNNIEVQVQELVASIKSKRASFDDEAIRLKGSEILIDFDKTNQESWCLSVIADSMVKLRLFTEQNFYFIETMGVISVARYIFELSVWLKLFEIDSRYGLVYYSELIKTQKGYWRDYQSQISREIELLNSLGIEQSQLLKKELKKLEAMEEGEEKQREVSNLYSNIAKIIDSKAARQFSIFAEQAKTNGYEFQLYLIKNKVLPEIEASISEIDREQQAFDASVSQNIINLTPFNRRTSKPKNWNWYDMAKRVGMANEYDFIYRFSSKLLHATPASVTTNQKNLELSEVILFLRFIDIKLLDALELAKNY